MPLCESLCNLCICFLLLYFEFVFNVNFSKFSQHLGTFITGYCQLITGLTCSKNLFCKFDKRIWIFYRIFSINVEELFFTTASSVDILCFPCNILNPVVIGVNSRKPRWVGALASILTYKAWHTNHHSVSSTYYLYQGTTTISLNKNIFKKIVVLRLVRTLQVPSL